MLEEQGLHLGDLRSSRVFDNERYKVLNQSSLDLVHNSCPICLHISLRCADTRDATHGSSLTLLQRRIVSENYAWVSANRLGGFTSASGGGTDRYSKHLWRMIMVTEVRVAGSFVLVVELRAPSLPSHPRTSAEVVAVQAASKPYHTLH